MYVGEGVHMKPSLSRSQVYVFTAVCTSLQNLIAPSFLIKRVKEVSLFFPIIHLEERWDFRTLVLQPQYGF